MDLELRNIAGNSTQQSMERN